MPDVARTLGYFNDNQSTWKLCDCQAGSGGTPDYRVRRGYQPWLLPARSNS
jgi:hypothetical protein